jgi:hypothetical protein
MLRKREGAGAGREEETASRKENACVWKKKEGKMEAKKKKESEKIYANKTTRRKPEM